MQFELAPAPPCGLDTCTERRPRAPLTSSTRSPFPPVPHPYPEPVAASCSRFPNLRPSAHAAKRAAWLELVERREAELEAAGDASELELVRTTLREVGGELDPQERRRLLSVVLGSLVVRKAPRGVDLVDRVELELGEPASDQNRTELREELAA